MLVLTVIQGPDKGRKFELPAHEPQLIGRSSEALPLEDSAISRRHAELTPDDGAWFINDLRSQNGTYVNGVRIAERTRLRVGDQVRCGQTLLVFGVTESTDPDVVRVVGPKQVDTAVDRTLASTGLSGGLAGLELPGSNEDSVILAVPEPRAAAIDHLRVIYRLTTLLSAHAMDRAALLKAVLDLAFAEFKPERGCVMMTPEGASGEAGQTVVRFREAPKDPDDSKILVSRTILWHVVQQGEGVLSTNAMTDPRFASGDSVQRARVRSAVCSPIRFREKVFGAIYIDSSVANYTFTHDQLALLNAIGQHTGLALSNQDLHEQKLQSERLAVMGETVAMLSHSIKNILQGLRGGADVVEMGLKKGDLKIARGGWTILKRNLDRIISLTMNMLAFSRQRRVEPELTPLGPLIDDCAQLLEGLCAQRQVALMVDVDPEAPPVAIDAPLVHQAVMNLLTNAVEAVDPGRGVVTARVTYHAGGADRAARPRVEIAVIDNGPGIPASKQPWIFEPFNTTKGLRGTGLGLAVAKRIAEEHGGGIVLESAEHRGATFRMVLPADAAHPADPSATTAQSPPRPLGTHGIDGPTHPGSE